MANEVHCETIKVLEKLSKEDFKSKIIQGVLLRIPGMFGMVDSFSAEKLDEKLKVQLISSFQEVGIPIPKSSKELDETMVYINLRLKNFGPTID